MATENEALEDQAVQRMALVDRNTVVLTTMGPSVDGEPDQHASSRILSYNLEANHWGGLNYKFGAWWEVGAGLTDEGGRRALFGFDDRTAMLNYADGPNGDEPGRLKPPATIVDIKWIDGHFYAVGGNEFLGRRDGPGEWTYLSLAASPDEARFSFSKLAGNAADNIFVVEDSRPFTIQHWNGRALRPLPLAEDLWHEGKPIIPKGMAFSPEGQLFIGGHRGQLLVGAADTGFLPLLYPEKTGKGSPVGLDGLAWYQGALWAVNGSQLLRLVNGEWEVQQLLGAGVRPMGFSYIEARDGALLVGGQTGAALFDGERWRHVFGANDADQWMQLRLLEQQHEDMGRLLESAKALRDLIRAQP